jgi:hypothetical protein
MPVSYDAIEPNVAQVEVNGSQVQVVWKCPATGRTVGQSTAYMSADSSLSGRVTANVKRSIVSEITYGAARFISGLLGGTAGRVLGNAAYTAAGDVDNRATSGVDYSEATRQAAIVAAFEQVQTSFVWDDRRKQFVAK